MSTSNSSINSPARSSETTSLLPPSTHSNGKSKSKTPSRTSTPSRTPRTPRTPRLNTPQEWINDLFSGKNALLVLYSVLLLVSSVGNSIFFKKMINSMPNYVNFLNQLTTVVFVPIYFVIVVYERLFTDYITKDMLEFPKSKFFVMGALDAVSGVFTLFGAIKTSGSLQALLSNTVIPITMVLAYFINKTRYAMIQYIGSITIVVGCGVALAPSFGGKHDESSEDNDLVFNFIFMLGIVPTALSSLYKEVAFVDADIDVNYMQAWVAVWQFVFGFMLIPLNTLSILGPAALEWKDLGRSLADGARCFMGTNIIVPPYCSPDMSQPELGACDQCEGAWIPVVLYLVFNWLFNIFIMLVIKYGSAAVMFVVMTLRLPLIQVAFAIPAINYPPDHLYWSSLFGLLIILGGLVAYRWAAVQEPLAKDEEELMVPHIGINLAYQTVRRRKVIVLGRDAKQIRSSLYSSLGIIDSPPTPYSPAHRHRGKSPQSGYSPATNAQLRAQAVKQSYQHHNVLPPAPGKKPKGVSNGTSSTTSTDVLTPVSSTPTSTSSLTSSTSSSLSSSTIAPISPRDHHLQEPRGTPVRKSPSSLGTHSSKAPSAQ